MATIFEKTMQACREAKALTEKTSKKLAKGNLNENKISKRRIKRESEEDDVEMDVADGIVAVIDPDVDADEMTSVAQGFQQLIDDAGANEIPETDEYIDDQIYGCPICGNKFFSETPMTDGDTCPVCGEEANGFVLVGEVASNDEASDDKEDAKVDDEEIDDTFDFDGEEIDVEIKGDVEKDSEEESKKATREDKALRRPTRRVRGEQTRRSTRRRAESVMNLDDISFNKYLNRFVRENYSNAKSFIVKSAKKNGNTLKIEGKISFKSGKSKRVVLNCNYNPNSRVMLARDNGAFKVESKNAPFMFKIRTVGNVIKCEGMKYNFKTTAKIQNEDKKVAVHGSYLGEAERTVRPIRRVASARKALESRRKVTRRPTTSKVAEARRVRRVRPSVRRTVESRRIARRPVARRSTVRTMEAKRLARRRLARPVAEGRRTITRRPTRRVESTRTTSRISRRPAVRRAESARVTRTRKPSVRRAESVRATRRTVRPTRRVESRRYASRRIARR